MSTSYDAQAADINVSAAKAGVEGSPRTSTPFSRRIARAYERFLGMPVLVVLAVMWVAGAVLLGSCALALYMVGSLLVRVIAGALCRRLRPFLLPLITGVRGREILRTSRRGFTLPVPFGSMSMLY
jgi:hypothetical protein